MSSGSHWMPNTPAQNASRSISKSSGGRCRSCCLVKTDDRESISLVWESLGGKTMRREFIAMLLALLMTGPAAASDNRVRPQQPLDLSVDTTAPRPEAAITPLDHLSVTVFREPDLSVEDVTVDESGRI